MPKRKQTQRNGRDFVYKSSGETKLLQRQTVLAFVTCFAVSALVYSIFIFHQLLNDHAIKLPWLPSLSEQVGHGRWMGPVISVLHYGADLPVFNPLLGLAMACLAIIVTIRLWGGNGFGAPIIVAGSAMSLFPTAMAFLYYSWITPMMFASWLFAAAAAAGAVHANWRWNAAGAVAVTLVLASYQASIEVFLIIVAGTLIMRLADAGPNLPAVEIQRCLITGARAAAVLVLGGLLYWISLAAFDVNLNRAASVDGIGTLATRFTEVVQAAFQHLWLSQPDLLRPVKIAGLVLLAAASGLTVYAVRGSAAAVALMIALWLAAIIATKAIFLISDPGGPFWQYRYNTSLAFLTGMSVWAAIRYCPRGVLRTSVISACALLVVVFAQADLARQSIMLRAQQHDMALANRVLFRIESLADLDRSKTYDLVRVGRYPMFRWRMLRGHGMQVDAMGDAHMDMGEVSALWVDEDVLELLGSSVRFQQSGFDPAASQKARALRESGALDDRQPWPHASSVFIEGDMIVVYMSDH